MRKEGAAVVGSGPNGLAAAVTLARAGIPVTVFEAAETIGGGTRTGEVVMPGVVHDICSAIHPMALASEFFQRFELTKRVEFVVPEASYAHPLDGGPAAVAYRDLDRTIGELGRDGEAYRRLFAPMLARLEGVLDFGLGGSMLRWPKSLPAAIAMGLRTLEQGSPLWNARFREDAAPALISGVAAHSIGTMPALSTAAVGLVLSVTGHAGGWPVPVGGSQAISRALADDLLAHGGRIETGTRIRDIGELDSFSVKVFDTSARDLGRIAARELPDAYLRELRRFRPGNSAAKVDLVLDGPIPWADARIAQTPTVHLGGTRSEIAFAEGEVNRGRHPDRPYVLLAQPTEFDPARNPAGLNAVWSYTHVPNGSTFDVSERVIAQIERFAPGVRDRILDCRVTTAAELGEYNPNYFGGDISAGGVQLRQLIARPSLSAHPWQTPGRGIYLASSSTPPGPGVHGLAGWHAARLVLSKEFSKSLPDLSVSPE
ncbi:phytoene desaturase family protein [Gulosibacter molinativorax]|uniref:Pyridine nucleotide-disulfide oxidoreductase domain-containing protein 2 n=1 Tax=Gulosibacter molinativorax TaxID=256821 RepID=A0ABT7C7S4_9MICO|nr:NAD(P)/FAD-dependent oxidoreductase [Gulosibacter molinativorax]MDJ1370782.1 NAD(P)/FAD-dependent oxidoreductase [Gulosibacter molinativorax]